MRPIKFRGKCIENGRFVYGKFVYGDLKHMTGGRIGISFDKRIAAVEVEPESVAQLVGYDANGNEVYEGDVLTFEHDGKHYEYTAGLHPFARNDDGLIHYKFDSLKLKEEPKP